ncbi:probable F-box protein At4g22030 [Dendrobium catenatum]|uniref:Putative F-box protein n=1 Tax=Dendrobium catenatum TaxID=906689 RepID=A0A2I0WE98_9ASPA|nr:probable F-box protein At4g22030 [Dendrobium catenatum]PKU73999.1 putative F-box protein [Dendrobium catenatum]
MAALQTHCLLQPSCFIPSRLPPCRGRWRASLQSLPKLQSLIPFEELAMLTEQSTIKRNRLVAHKEEQNNSLITAKLLAIAEAAADRAEMHAIIGEQRNNWNHLFLHSINSINLTASLMAAIASIPEIAASQPLNLSSAVLFTSAAGLMLLVNKIQPSQLAEEQRNAARLFKQLERSIRSLGASTPSESDVEEAMEKVLALQKAYPLPLLPGMLEKFPKVVEPTKWWPKQKKPQRKQGVARNGWSSEMEKEMRGVLRVLKSKDEEQYVRLGQLVLSINKFLSFAGPLLAGVAAVGAASSIGGGAHGSWPAVVGGALAAVVNTLEHGGQVGMVFELFRNCAGFYRRLEEEIEYNLGEEEEMREQGEVFEVKMALELGRSLSELRRMGSYSSPSYEDEDIEEFAGKLF